jgi:sigma-70-like protein
VHESEYIDGSGPFEARYLAFLETISTFRPSLHRYCARMTGSVLDGEDVVQEALFEAYRKLDKFDQSRPIDPLATAFNEGLSCTANDVGHLQRWPVHAFCVCSPSPRIVSASSGLPVALRCRRERCR